MNDSFYTIPAGVTHALVKHSYITGSILVPYDPLSILSDQLRKHRYTVTTNTDESNLVDPIWWTAQKEKKYDWVVAATTGLGDHSEYILEYGIQIATQGIAVLDRLSFIEPVAKRKSFLLANKISNMIVLNPRPKFSAVGSTRDSVTSCWFVIQRPEVWHDSTQITFGINWDRVEPLPPLSA